MLNREVRLAPDESGTMKIMDSMDEENTAKGWSVGA
jgi:hypothetical protein